MQHVMLDLVVCQTGLRKHSHSNHAVARRTMPRLRDQGPTVVCASAGSEIGRLPTEHTDCTAKVLHKDLSLLHLRRVHLRPHHGAEWHLKEGLEGMKVCACCCTGRAPQAGDVDADGATAQQP